MEIMSFNDRYGRTIIQPVQFIYSARYVENNQVQAPNKTFIM